MWYISKEDLLKRRLLYLILGMLIEVIAGAGYANSVLQGAIIERFHCTLTQATLIYTLSNLCTLLYSLFFSARVHRAWSPCRIVLTGGIFFGLGYVIGGFVQGSIFLFYLPMAFLRQAGCVMMDPTLKTYAVELFPDRPGFASGMMAAAFGLAAVIWAPVTTRILTSTNLTTTLLILGIADAGIVVCVSLLLRNVPASYLDMFQQNSTSSKLHAVPDRYYSMGRKQVLRTPLIYVILVSLMLTQAGGNAILSQVAYWLSHYFGFSADTAALSVSAIAVANTLGRIVCGTAADKLGQTRTVFFAQILTVIAFAGCGFSSSGLGFTLFCMMAVFLYGGISTLLAPMGGEIFGSHYMSENFTLFYLVFPLGGLSGPVITSTLIEATDSANFSLLICGAMAFVGLLLMGWVMRHLKKIEKPIVPAEG